MPNSHASETLPRHELAPHVSSRAQSCSGGPTVPRPAFFRLCACGSHSPARPERLLLGKGSVSRSWSGRTCPSHEDRACPELPSSAGPPAAAAWPGSSSSALASWDWAVQTKAGGSLSWPRGRPTEALGEHKCPWSQPAGRPRASLLLWFPAHLRLVVFTYFSFHLTFLKHNHMAPLGGLKGAQWNGHSGDTLFV